MALGWAWEYMLAYLVAGVFGSGFADLDGMSLDKTALRAIMPSLLLLESVVEK